ncbi:hypothetical protein PR048_023078 [Dryococelus australis]|uniref:Uncharacterized protein n=1 Tax=Dryococelus australis TaxID=614101 RepID=A0ABQ9GT30_9NEOP|nr:hypothetical protein PR048_023078 [Dryococelus australis]
MTLFHFWNQDIKYLTDNILQDMQSRVKEGFVGVGHVSLTSDLWSTHARDDFIPLTAHFVDNNFEHRSLIATILKEFVELWELNGKIHAVLTVNAGNMVNGIAKANYHHLTKYFRCLCKSQMNNSTFETLSSSKLLKNFQKNHNMPVHCLIQDEPTRWNSREHLVEQWRPVMWLTPEISIHTELTSSEWSLSEHAVKTLKSFYLATLNISNENVTVTEVIPTVNGLKSELTTLTEQQYSELKGVQKDMIHSLCCRLRSIETNNVFTIATLLDPRCPEAEVEIYFAEPPIPINSNPLQYWKTSPCTSGRKAAKNICPHQLGLWHRRDFTSVGSTSSKKRSSLYPE